MTDQAAKLGFKDRIGLLGYGINLVAQLTPSYLLLSAIRALMTASQPMLTLFFSARILSELAGGRDVRVIIACAALAVGLTFAFSSLRALLTREIETSGGWERAYHRMQMMEAERFALMDYAYAEDQKISETLARMDTHAMGNGLGLMNMYYHPPRAIESLFTLIFSGMLLTGRFLPGGGAPTGWAAWALYGIMALGMLFRLLMLSRERAMLEKVYAENAKANTAANFYHDYITVDKAAKDIRLYRQADALDKIMSESFSLRSWLGFFFFEGRKDGYSAAILSAIGGGFYLLAGLGALNGTISVGAIVQTVGAVAAFAGALGALFSLLGQIYNNAAFLKPMREYLTLPDLLAKGTLPVPQGDGHEFEFRNVSFKYPGSDEYALRALNLKLNAGQRLAVVGLNGSGKTTMIKLLCRLYDPTEGEILLNGVDIKAYDYNQYTALFSVVFQDFALFPLWLGQNVAVAEGYDAMRVNQCLDLAGAGERAAAMRDGLDTVLYKRFDESGLHISGGEAQKIALARALYKDAPMVVLDEPTAALDPIAEYEVYSTFDQTIGKKTAVFISHRLSSCRFCHDIAVFEGGKLIQRGSHDALLADESGRYRELWNAQAKHYTDAGQKGNAGVIEG